MKVPLTQSSSGTGFPALFSKICQPIKWLILVPNIIVGAVDDDSGHEGDDIYDAEKSFPVHC